MVKDVTSATEFDQILSTTTYVVVDFYATWCPPCKQIAPFYESLSQKHSVPDYLMFIKLDVEKVQTIASRYGISAMPTFMFFKEGKQVAVNANALLRGADSRTLNAAAEKLGGLARRRADEAATSTVGAASV